MQQASIRLPGWYRAMTTAIGLLSIVLAFIVLADPALGVLTLVFILGFALLVIGLDRMVAGITGHPFGTLPGIWMGPPPTTGSPPSTGSQGPQTPK